MIEALTTSILPVFAVLAIGFAMGLRGMLDQSAAPGVNRFVLLIAAPALVFSVLSVAPLASFEWDAVLVYLAAEVVVYALGFAVGRANGRDIRESLLLGMTACFANHILFVLPIALILVGPEVGPPIGAIVATDSALIFGGTVIALEHLSRGEGGSVRAARRIATNPMLIAPALGLGLNVAGIVPHDGVLAFAKFAGAAAAPAALFALGVTLSGGDYRRIGRVSLMIAGLALFAHPGLAWALSQATGPSFWTDTLVVVAAGPCGAMPFALALYYGVATDSIAKAILISTTLSVATLSVLL